MMVGLSSGKEASGLLGIVFKNAPYPLQQASDLLVPASDTTLHT